MGRTMPITLTISPHGRPLVEATAGAPEDSLMPAAAATRIAAAFHHGAAHGLLALATAELQTPLPPELDWARGIGRTYVTRMCQAAGPEATEAPAIEPPTDELNASALAAPPMKGLEYLTGDVLTDWWRQLDELVRREMADHPGGAGAYLRERNPLWRLVGRVTFHLAENKRDPNYPFAFLATYATRLSSTGRVQQQPLGRALQEFAGAKNKPALLSLLTPIQRAAERLEWVRRIIEAGEIYHPQRWSPHEAYAFLRDIPSLEESGLIVRVPDWWNASRPPRPMVSVKVGDKAKGKLSAESLLDFHVGVTVAGEPLSEAELRSILDASGGLVSLRGRWVEVDREKLSEALQHWKQVERDVKGGGVTFFEGMRLLAGAPLAGDAAAKVPDAARQWTGITGGTAIERTLHELRESAMTADATPPDLHATLRPYQQSGVHWLRFMTGLGLGACLADDMGLGKTIQVISLLLHRKRQGGGGTSLLIVPASLIANWKAEIARFGPSLNIAVMHPSEKQNTGGTPVPQTPPDLVITTYGMLTRAAELRERKWDVVILDEAQAIKNSGTRQSRAVKELKASARIALTGTPVENRLSDLWSLFDFLNPGLLGSAKAFGSFVKKLSTEKENPYGPLRTLARPYILRRLKTDKKVIADLPDKVEVNAFCTLSRKQAALYEQSVRELGKLLNAADGIQRKGVVLAYLMRLKQICNHPAQVGADGSYAPADSGKFQRLAEICGELAERQEKVLVFTQFREIADPLAEFLSTVFGRDGLVLHGGTAVAKRKQMVADFQREDGPPFFVLTVKAGGTGLNLTEASHVIHFDRWWNPAVENQATDRAFRIGQKRNVFVHKFVCRGTVEDKIDELIAQKVSLSRDLLDDASGAEALLTEMSNDQLLRFVALDVNKAVEAT
jgi:non-specific serine/threonine protein kinase